MSSIRILHIVGIMNRGGLETLIMNIYRNIDRSKIQFDFLVTREESGAFDEEIKSLGGKIYNIPKMEKVGYTKYRKNLEWFFSNHPEYKIVHCHRNMLSGIYLKIANRCGIPVRISHSHNTRIIEKKNFKGIIKQCIKLYSKLYIKKNATDYLACGYDAAKWLYGEEIAKNNTLIINNGIDTDIFKFKQEIRENVRSNLGIDDKTILIGHVGRFELQKNHEFLIDIFNKVKIKNNDTKLCLVGDGSLKTEIEKKVIKMGLKESVFFMGIRNDINNLMMAFDILLFPSLFEGLPVTLIEAQTTGLNCIISDQISEECILTENVYVESLENTEEVWANKVIQINTNNREDMYEQIANKGYDINNTVEIITKFYIDRNK